MEETVQPATGGGYSKRPLWQWLVIYVILGAIVYGAIYYFFLSKNNSYNNSKSSIEYSSPSPSQAAVMSGETTVTLKPVNNSNEAGTAVLKEENGQTKVTINLTGFTKDLAQPAHIHVGECPGVGSVKYPLTSIMNGISTTTLSVNLDQLKKELPLAINVHKSAAEASVYTACGPISF